jgi:pyruvate/2-oxoglutarate dehydrogenase complex dihydrolipoamide acyltransferase (E2) component
VVEWDDYVGRFAPSQTVELRPRVAGQITALHFHDGDIVRKGQLLFTIDQRPYRAALAEASANVASARSALALARSDYARASRLSGDEAVSAGEVDSLRARLQSAQAALAAAEARLRDVRLISNSPKYGRRFGPFRIAASMSAIWSRRARAAMRLSSPPSTRSIPSISRSIRPKPCSSSPSAHGKEKEPRPRSRSACRMSPPTHGRAS